MSRSSSKWILCILTGMLMVAGVAGAATVTVDTGTGKGSVSKTFVVEMGTETGGRASFQGKEIQWLGSPGEPKLPWGTVTILLPPNARPASVKCVVNSWMYEPVAGRWTVDPVQPPTTLGKDGKIVAFWPQGRNIVNGRDMAIYGVNAFWPGDAARLMDTGKMRKWQLARIAVPLAVYNPVTGALSKLARVNVSVAYDRSVANRRAAAEVRRPDPAGLSRAREIALNFDLDADAYGEATGAGVAANGTVAPTGLSSTGYFIFTTSAIQSASTQLAAFVTQKQSKGYNVQVKTETTWGGGAGDTAANNIRTWLKNNYVASDIKYVLFIGDPTPSTSAVPMKLCRPYYPNTGYDDYPTDFYYAELSGTWDLNGDGIYGSWEQDSGSGGMDQYWEVITARIPYYGSITDLDAILVKTINYENAADKSWRRRALLAFVPTGGDATAYMGENIRTGILKPQAIPYHRIYNEDYNCLPPPETTPNSETTDPAVWAATPYGLVLWCTHGGAQGAGEIITSAGTAALNDSYPVAVWQGSCETGRPEDSNNLGYAILKRGGINTCAASRMVVGPAYTQYEYADRLINLGKTPGEALMDMKPMWTHGDLLAMNIYGDPSLQIIPPAPTQFAVSTDMWYARGNAGGPFNTSDQTYILKNPYTSSISWTATKTAAWLQVSPASGSIAAGGTATVTVSLTSSANSLALGSYTDTITFRDTTHSFNVLRTAKVDVLLKQLIGHWKLDDASGTTADDASAFERSATLQGGVAFGTNSVAGKFGNALNLDGVDDCLSGPGLKMSRNNATFTAWIKRNGNQPSYTGLFFNRANSTCAGFHFGAANDLKYTWAGTNDAWSSGLTVPDNTWVFVALVVTPTNATIYMYNTSLQSATNTATHPLQYFGYVNPGWGFGTTIGQDYLYPGWMTGGGRFFAGAMDDVRIYDYALSSAEIQAVLSGPGARAVNPQPVDGCQTVSKNAKLYWGAGTGATARNVYIGTDYTTVLNATTASPEFKGRFTTTSFDPSLNTTTMYYWRVDEIAGTTVTKGDVWWFITLSWTPDSGQKFHGTMDTVDISGTTLINKTGLTQYNGTIYGSPANPTGQILQALTMNGTSQYVGVPAMNFNSNTVTITAWIKRNGTQPTGGTGVVFCRAGNTCAGLNIGNNVANDVGYTWNASYDTYGKNSGLIVPDATWVLTALVVQPDKAAIYMGNGGGQVSRWINPIAHGPEEFDGVTHIGTDITYSRFFKGDMDDVGIWDRALSTSEIQAIYDGGVGGATYPSSDTTAPTPNPMTFATAPYAVSSTSIAMVASTASDASGVEYLFVNTAGGGHSSAWQSGTSYTDTGLTPSTSYTYKVMTRDKSFNRNKSTASAPASATTLASGPVTYYPGSYVMNQGTYVSGTLPSSVQTDNNVYFVVASTTSGTTRYATTDFTVSSITGGTPTQIGVSVRSKSSRSSTTQRIYLWNYTTSVWDQKDSTTISTSEVTRSFNVTTGMANYLSGGQLKVRTYSSHGSSQSFNLSHEIISVTITP